MVTKYRINLKNLESLVEEIEIISETKNHVFIQAKGDFKPVPSARVSPYNEIFDRKRDAYLRLLELAEKNLDRIKADRAKASKLLNRIKKMPMEKRGF